MTTTEVMERPILFSGPMVRALLDGRKTQTRRVVKPQPDKDCKSYCRIHDEPGMWADCYGSDETPMGEDTFIRCPYGWPGQRLWVRETVCLLGVDHWFDDSKRKDFMYCLGYPRRNGCAYRAETDSDGEAIRKEYGYKWTPAIHMPRWASRILLEITDVRVQRLQEISHQDALAEGLGSFATTPLSLRNEPLTVAQLAFSHLWDSINGARGKCKTCKGHGVIPSWAGSIHDGTLMQDSEDCPTCKGNANSLDWEASPWVWAITFKALTATA